MLNMIKKSGSDQNILLTPEEIRRNSALSLHINQLMDIEAISSYGLWKDWGKLGPQGVKLLSRSSPGCWQKSPTPMQVKLSKI